MTTQRPTTTTTPAAAASRRILPARCRMTVLPMASLASRWRPCCPRSTTSWPPTWRSRMCPVSPSPSSTTTRSSSPRATACARSGSRIRSRPRRCSSWHRCPNRSPATAVARLVSEGVIAWDDPVQPYLPDFVLSDPWVTERVTFADLFSHRSGLPGLAGTRLETIGFSRDEILARLRFVALDPFPRHVLVLQLRVDSGWRGGGCRSRRQLRGSDGPTAVRPRRHDGEQRPLRRLRGRAQPGQHPQHGRRQVGPGSGSQPRPPGAGRGDQLVARRRGHVGAAATRGRHARR